MFVHYLIFLRCCFLHLPIGRQTQPRGRRDPLHGWLAVGVAVPWGHKHTQNHAKGCCATPSHPMVFSSPVLDREVNLAPASPSRLSSGQQSQCSGRAVTRTRLQFSGWVFSPQQLTVLLFTRQLFLVALLCI